MVLLSLSKGFHFRKKKYDLISGKFQQTSSNNPDDQKWAYFREDMMFHVSHSLVHRIFEAVRDRNHQLEGDYRGRINSLFFYAHQQMMRKANIELATNGLPEIVPLSLDEWEKSLGPGITVGWYAWKDLGGRIDNCNIKEVNSTAFDDFKNNFYDKMMIVLEKAKDEEAVADAIVDRTSGKSYHSRGHALISSLCHDNKDCGKGHRCMGLMEASEASARDPVFFRWHGHLEYILQKFRDTKLPVYDQKDFPLADGVKVKKVRTSLSKKETGGKWNLNNILVTFMEDTVVDHHEGSSVLYNRLNHVPFKYKINLDNPNKSTKKVIVRLWLGLLNSRDK